jgi:hypothetical protein
MSVEYLLRVFRLCSHAVQIYAARWLPFFPYCNVPGVLFTMKVYFRSKKVNTLQLNTISHYPNTRRASTLSDVSHKTPSTRPLLVISQHELIFLQSESLQTQVLAQPLRSSGTNSNSCSQEASKHSCFSRNFPILTQSSSQQESVAKYTRESTLGDFQTRIDYKSMKVRRQQSRDHRNVSVSTVACLTMLRIRPPFELLRC